MDRSVDLRRAQLQSSTPAPRAGLNLLAHTFGGRPVAAEVTTRQHFPVEPQALWQALLFYEEIKTAPPWLLRLFLPVPRSTQGAKSEPSASVLCEYEGGWLLKRMTRIQAPTLLHFEMVEQHLGIETCAVALGGSYEILAQPGGCEVALTTRYRTVLRPRWLWRPLEVLLTTALHRHILAGMREHLHTL